MKLCDFYQSLLHNNQDWYDVDDFIGDLESKYVAFDSITTEQDLENHILQNHNNVLHKYSAYLKRRSDGGKRELFVDKLHAKWFILQISPTKLVDGAWLRNVALLPSSATKDSLLRVYLDEIGQYDEKIVTKSKESQNHVDIYLNLLQSLYNDINRVEDVIYHPLLHKDNDIFLPGCIQLALGAYPEEFLPEIVGYNLGYEQLPLHLLITAYELKELGIDSTYFDVHVAVDNFHCGHAHLALKAAKTLLENTDKSIKKSVFHRILVGFHLSDIVSDGDRAKQYDLKNIVNTLLQQKAEKSHSLHDTVGVVDNEFSSLGELMRHDSSDLYSLMEKSGYLEGKSFKDTRFGQILQDKMIGTFTRDELDFVENLFDTKGEHDETATDDRIYRLFAPVIYKHRKILMTHPETGEQNTMDEWFNKDQVAFLTCLSTKEMKERTLESFLHGRMKNIKMTAQDKEFILHWLRE